MGHGLNAQQSGAHNMIIYSPNPNYEEFEQVIARLRRSGNKSKRVFVYLIMARKTIDEVTWELLQRKDSGQRSFLEALSEYTENRHGRALRVGSKLPKRIGTTLSNRAGSAPKRAGGRLKR
jgi:predicted CopG family antitoxin